jgi:hypothetical protein
MAKLPEGFVSLKSIKQGAPSTDEALGTIRRIYFKTTKQTIEHDLAHAIELLKGLDSEEARERASVFMEGLAEMRKEWQRAGDAKRSAAHPASRNGKPPRKRR